MPQVEEEEDYTLASSQRSLRRPDTRARNFRTAISLTGPRPLLEPFNYAEKPLNVVKIPLDFNAIFTTFSRVLA